MTLAYDVVFAALVAASVLGLLRRAVGKGSAAPAAGSGRIPRTRSPVVASAPGGALLAAVGSHHRQLRDGIILRTIFGPVRPPVAIVARLTR